MPEPKERPIIFSGPMVRAILEGRKTQTRRVIKDPSKLRIQLRHMVHGDFPIGHNLIANRGVHRASLNQHGAVSVNLRGELLGIKPNEMDWVSPYGMFGDRLWVRETCRYVQYCGHATIEDPNIAGTEGGHNYFLWSLGSMPYPHPFWEWRLKYGVKACPAIFMPRWASRITLRVAAVKVERLQSISESDAREEGVEALGGQLTGAYTLPPAMSGTTAKECYRRLWDHLNENRGFGWDTNPWVWAVAFALIEVKK